LQVLDKLVGTWKISGEADGEVTYEWLEGGFFLVLRGRMEREGKAYEYLGVIGYDRAPGAGKPADELTSRIYTSRGETLDYTSEADDENLTIWLGERARRRSTAAGGARTGTRSRAPGNGRAAVTRRR
jgi:hypothetical protein